MLSKNFMYFYDIDNEKNQAVAWIFSSKGRKVMLKILKKN